MLVGRAEVVFWKRVVGLLVGEWSLGSIGFGQNRQGDEDRRRGGHPDGLSRAASDTPEGNCSITSWCVSRRGGRIRNFPLEFGESVPVGSDLDMRSFDDRSEGLWGYRNRPPMLCHGNKQGL